MTTLVKPNGKKDTNNTTPTQPTRRVAPVNSLRSALNKLFDEFSMSMAHPWTDDFGGVFVPRVDIKENEKNVVISAELPGIPLENIEIALLGDRLSVKGEKKEEHEESRAGYYRSERSFGSFERLIPLPCEVDRDAVAAVTKDGLLTITLPKTKEAQAKARKIEIKKA